MKYLLVLAVVLVAAYIWKRNRRRDDSPLPPGSVKRPKAIAPTVMVACLQCGTHLPEAEAIRGQRGSYCSHEHRRLSEDGTR
ncbi:MAG: PP0621 family protein [Hydrogenophaga sp.]|jgi:uncharacterized protein|nr:hypothetical protein [Hydrogenophaga sp.]